MRGGNCRSFVDQSLAGKDLICFAPGDWGPPLMSVHQIMMRLAEEMRILYIEPPPSDPWSVKPATMIKKLVRWCSRPKQVQANLYVCSLPPGIPFKRMFRLLNRLTYAYVSKIIAAQVASLGITNPLVWLTWPTQVDVLGKFGETFTIYHVADELAAIPWARRSVVNDMEAEILRRGDLVITSSQPVYDARKDRAKRIILVPNGVDYALFSQVTSVPPDLVGISRPIIGFSGAIDRRFDIPLMQELVERYQRCSFVLMGPLHINLGSLIDSPNVHYLGMKPVHQVPSYLANFDVCLIPYLINEYTRALSPLKLLEYLALGKPTVSTPIPGCLQYEGLVYIGESREAFVDLVGQALEECDPDLELERRRCASRSTWENRVRIISRAIAEALSEASH